MKKSDQMKNLMAQFNGKKPKEKYDPLPLNIILDAKNDRVHEEKRSVRKRIRIKRI